MNKKLIIFLLGGLLPCSSMIEIESSASSKTEYSEENYEKSYNRLKKENKYAKKSLSSEREIAFTILVVSLICVYCNREVIKKSSNEFFYWVIEKISGHKSEINDITVDNLLKSKINDITKDVKITKDRKDELLKKTLPTQSSSNLENYFSGPEIIKRIHDSFGHFVNDGIPNLFNTCYFNAAIQWLIEFSRSNKELFNLDKKVRVVTPFIQIHHAKPGASVDLETVNEIRENILTVLINIIMIVFRMLGNNFDQNFFVENCRLLIATVNSIGLGHFDPGQQADAGEFILSTLSLLCINPNQLTVHPNIVNAFNDLGNFVQFCMANQHNKRIMNNVVDNVLNHGRLPNDFSISNNLFVNTNGIVANPEDLTVGNYVTLNFTRIDYSSGFPCGITSINGSIPMSEIYLERDGVRSIYVIRTFVVRDGNYAGNGHYYTVKLINGQWYEFNDIFVKEISNDYANTLLHEKATIALYQKINTI